MPTENPEEAKMSFWSHLEELRKRIVYIAIAVGIGFILCFNYSEQILGLLLVPMNSTAEFISSFPFIHFVPHEVVQELHFTSLTEPIMAHLKIGFVGGIIVMVPIILYEIWKFIAPGLLPRERTYAGQFVFFSTLFFAAGVIFCYLLLLPFAIPFLVSYKTEHLKPIIKIGDYIDFTLKFLLASGAVFELPLVMIVLGRMGIIKPESLSKFRKYAFLISFVLGGILTPTPDVFNMTIMSLPIYLLYELGILGVRILGRKKKGPDSTSLTET
jgi:sec-independent protein translocase protein TatC